MVSQYFKLLETPDAQVMIEKKHNPEPKKGKAEYSIEASFYVPDEDVSIKVTLNFGYKIEKERDNQFELFDNARATNIYNQTLKSFS